MTVAKKTAKTMHRAEGERRPLRALGSPVEALKNDNDKRILGAGAAPGELDAATTEKIARYFGAGAACDKPHQIAMHIVDGLDCGVEDLQSVAENRAFYEGPLTAAAVASLFIPKKEMFSIGTADGAVDAAQINVEGNQLDCSVLITHVYFHLVTPKESMLVEGAAWAGTGVLTTGTQTFIPVVPDAWSAADAVTAAAGGVLGLLTGQTLTKAYLDVGGWMMDGFYDFCQAYEWLWKIGNNIILEIPLTEIASTVPAAQPGTSGRDRRPFAQYVADCNAYYRANGTLALFLPRNATRDGSYNTNATGQSVFSPYGYFEEDVTYGGPGVQKLGCNPEMYELPVAQLFPARTSSGCTSTSSTRTRSRAPSASCRSTTASWGRLRPSPAPSSTTSASRPRPRSDRASRRCSRSSPARAPTRSSSSRPRWAPRCSRSATPTGSPASAVTASARRSTPRRSRTCRTSAPPSRRRPTASAASAPRTSSNVRTRSNPLEAHGAL